MSVRAGEERQPETGMEALADRLLALAGLSPARRCERLPRGGNNRVFRVCSGEKQFLLKQYRRHPSDRRDRMGAECRFLRFCARHGVARVPELIAADSVAGVALHSWIAGQALAAGEATAEAVEEAARFLAELAALSEAAETAAMPEAADSCRTPEEQANLAEQRLCALEAALAGAEKDTGAGGGRAYAFVRNALRPELTLRLNAARKFFGAAQWSRPIGRRIPSPSDFGFHNALRTERGLIFVDFEYAGMDDVLKAVCDFLCQPAVPAPDGSLEILLRALGYGREMGEAIGALLPLCRIKWCGIMLNAFRTAEAGEIHFASGEEPAVRRARQLAKAEAYFSRYMAGGK